MWLIDRLCFGEQTCISSLPSMGQTNDSSPQCCNGHCAQLPGVRPREPHLSGLEPLILTPNITFVNIGEV